MASVQFLHLTPKDLTGEGTPPDVNIGVGLGLGIGFPELEVSAVLAAFLVPAAVALGTGLSISLLLADDPLNSSPGKVAQFGVTVGPIVSTSTYDESTTGPLAGSTEVTANVTTPATAGVLVTLAIAVPIADMNSLAAPGWCLIRIRRNGTAAADTHRGRVVLLGADIGNT